MKLCHENNGSAIYVERATTVHNPLFESVHTTVEYLDTNVSIGQLLKHISKCIVACSRLLERSTKERARGRKRRRGRRDENEGGWLPHPRRFHPLALSFARLSRSLEQAKCIVVSAL